jgi:hypothetical protein
MDANELKGRTKQFGLRVMKVVESLSNARTANVIGNQLWHSSISVGTNYPARLAVSVRKQTLYLNLEYPSKRLTNQFLGWNC